MINKNTRSFICGIKGYKLSKSEIKFLRKYKPWGIILFSRNIKTIKQTQLLTKSLKNILQNPTLPILIDEEGGRVSRLRKFIDNSVFTNKYFGDLYKKDKKKFNLYFDVYVKQISYLLRLLGINVNTSPVLDLRIKGASNIIGNRSFSNNPKIVSKIGDYCINYFHQNGIGTVIKHIPGHGLAKVDSHHFTPMVNKKLSYLTKRDFLPFKNKKTFFAMTAHIIFTQIDKENCVTHSKKFIKLIRNKIGFKDILISDDLSMKSLKGNLKENTIKTFSAGCNLALHCNGNLNEMKIVGNNSPLINPFLVKKTSQFYKILS